MFGTSPAARIATLIAPRLATCRSRLHLAADFGGFAKLVYNASTSPRARIACEFQAFNADVRTTFWHVTRLSLDDDACGRAHWTTGTAGLGFMGIDRHSSALFVASCMSTKQKAWRDSSMCRKVCWTLRAGIMVLQKPFGTLSTEPPPMPYCFLPAHGSIFGLTSIWSDLFARMHSSIRGAKNGFRAIPPRAC